MERIVIVAYKPLPGKERELKSLMKSHWEILHQEGLVTDRKSIICQSNDGTIIEVFGWKSQEAVEQSHSNENVQKMWKEYSKVCEYVPISEVPESNNLFSEFNPVEFE
ncbi:hypothetical protein OO013_05695 [Mangrovivirga sp. M17]|uniref:ABM domain-containing protein n=1 Tax=Mangrovivirga halotolerans TaxID=2993936 RepID=A0ABT3RNG3_9BACT|nr:hypothetical protein [Mangrovivirga halotolerans]MCX2743348.1 hypothetical protein [Mangrovivirga halotolerans]